MAQFRDNIYLYHYPQVHAIPPLMKFKQWVLGSNLWSKVLWDIFPIELHPEEDIIFVHVMDVCYYGFGQHLHNLQVKCDHMLLAILSIQTTICDPPPHHI